MKVGFNTYQINEHNTGMYTKLVNKPAKAVMNKSSVPSFRGGADDTFLLRYSEYFKCAYGGLDMISKGSLAKLFAKFPKRPNVQSAINLLQSYTRYLYSVETRIFDLFDSTDHKSKKDFQHVLRGEFTDSLERLRTKEKNVLSSTDSMILRLSPKTREQVEGLISKSFRKIDKGSFTRSMPLGGLKNIKCSDEDAKIITKIHRAWYKLPRTSRDFDAFVVVYADQPHIAIAKRLMAPAEATIEHIKPQTNGGEDNMSNYLLTCAMLNHERNDMPLDEFIMLTPEFDISLNLQKYTDMAIEEIHRKDSLLSDKSWYPQAIQRRILDESSGFVNLDTAKLVLNRAQKKENASPEKLSQKFTVTKK